MFLDFFKKKNHQIVRSASLVPDNDPTLLFTNAGMVQFKRTFLGEEPRGYNRATSSQKCVRAGGKHNDLENVGYTARHHTFFEMLGNFSFGDYFKEGAVEFAWELLTEVFKLPKDNLWISIYTDDDEAYELWNKNIGISGDRIVRFGEEDNFWAMGDTGPCGPCSEIHIDRGEEFACGPDCKIGCECDRFLEIWNLVFMQFNRNEKGELTPLPKPSIDTGMGLERIVSILQNVSSNYDTDLILPIMNKVEELAGIKLGKSFESDVAMKVIADHSRAASFLIGDGVMPSNEGRGYVLRRIMRRAIRYGRNIGLKEAFLDKTSETVFDIMKPAYPELIKAKAFILNVIQNEEKRFSETLDKGLKILTDTLSDMKAKGESKISGDTIFKLYDTYGFPVDIVRDIVRDTDMTLDMDGFDKSMEVQKKQSKSKVSFEDAGEAYKKLSSEKITTQFTGYSELTCDSNIIAIIKDGIELKEINIGDEAEIIADSTCFYAESGGQAGDTGKITNSKGLDIKIENTIKNPSGIIIHKGKVISGSLTKSDIVTLSVNKNQREKTALNHSATHILHYALKKVLGDHVKQAGSLVTQDRLRFDFTHFSQVTKDELHEIERIVNDKIRENQPISINEMDIEKAMEIGATALFEEKYGDVVRMVSMGDFSKELCGGTHTEKTGNIGFLKIETEESIASGIRRIEGLTGDNAVLYVQKNEKILFNAAGLVKDSPENIEEKIEKLLLNKKLLENEIEKLKSIIASKSADIKEDDFKIVNGIKVIAKEVETDDPGALRELADKLKDKIKSGVVVLAGKSDKKVFLIAAVTKDITNRFKADDIVKKAGAIVGGGGGGRADMAQAGGTMPEKINDALNKVYEIINEASNIYK
jgi:alanyl-tRNA synthetase